MDKGRQVRAATIWAAASGSMEFIEFNDNVDMDGDGSPPLSAAATTPTTEAVAAVIDPSPRPPSSAWRFSEPWGALTDLLLADGATSAEIDALPPAARAAGGSARSWEEARASMSVLHHLAVEAGFTGSDLAVMVTELPVLANASSASELRCAKEALSFLTEAFNFRRYDLRRVTRIHPQVLLPLPDADGEAGVAAKAEAAWESAADGRGRIAQRLSTTLQALESGPLKLFNKKAVRAAVEAHPALLTLDKRDIESIDDWFAGDAGLDEKVRTVCHGVVHVAYDRADCAQSVISFGSV